MGCENTTVLDWMYIFLCTFCKKLNYEIDFVYYYYEGCFEGDYER